MGSAAACWGLLGVGRRADGLSDGSFTSPSMLGVFLAQEVPVLLPDHIESLDEDELSASTCHIGNPRRKQGHNEGNNFLITNYMRYPQWCVA